MASLIRTILLSVEVLPMIFLFSREFIQFTNINDLESSSNTIVMVRYISRCLTSPTGSTLYFEFLTLQIHPQLIYARSYRTMWKPLFRKRILAIVMKYDIAGLLYTDGRTAGEIINNRHTYAHKNTIHVTSTIYFFLTF